jgi:hypothetical protein
LFGGAHVLYWKSVGLLYFGRGRDGDALPAFHVQLGYTDLVESLAAAIKD